MRTTSAAILMPMPGEVGYALRLPPELKAKLEEWARDERRSLNAQIVYLLDLAVKARESQN